MVLRNSAENNPQSTRRFLFDPTVTRSPQITDLQRATLRGTIPPMPNPLRVPFPMCLSLLIAAWSYTLLAESTTPQKSGSSLPCDPSVATVITAHRSPSPIIVDGRLNEAAWSTAQISPTFVDLISGKPTRFGTRVRLLWDDTDLYVAYQIEETRVRASLTNHNDAIYTENDVELFIASDDAYYEFEINARNTVYEVFFLWESAYETGGFSSLPELNRKNLQPFNGVGFTTHPRGRRLGHFNWRFPGLKTAVYVDGTLNDDTDIDRGWSVEIKLPWAGMQALEPKSKRSHPPQHGEEWRLDFSRFNTAKEAAPAKDSGGWALSPHGIWDSHVPECFARVRFSTNTPSSKPVRKNTGK